ncbi:putative nuclease HARBI1 [Topomyia yanbarensis]|uniref:putative nuclease HARBI1 n=1 Tax=Topomyia yanbarensis TaxID=2498891 RepID=UPI00273AB8C2|nr:putative nuclease HARBI1 [Topomyia yanbarensis]
MNTKDLIAEIFDSSSSSDESSCSSESTSSSEDYSSDIGAYFTERLVRSKRKKVEDFVGDVIYKYSDHEFKSHFRLTRTAAYALIEEFESSCFFKVKKRGGRHVVPAEKQMLSFLWFAANKDSYREVANLFNITQSTVYRTFGYILDFFSQIAQRYIKFPNTEEEKNQTSNDFQQIAQFPNVLGCVDGCYISIRKPARKMAHTYVNRHDQLSITLQAVCNAKREFIDVDVGYSSRMHDARIFENSFISEKLPRICGQQFHILGDAAYPLREFLLVPFKDYGNLSNMQRNYNLKFSQTRVTIENVFGLLKTRFRQLMRLDFHSVERMALFVLACCVLHNLCAGDHMATSESSNQSTENIPEEGEIGERIIPE